MITIADASTVLSRAAIFDQRLARPSAAVVGAWAEELGRHNLELPDLLAAVSDYYSIGRDRVIQVGDVIAAARAARQRRALTEATEQARALPAGQPPRYEGGSLTADGQPVQAAYEVDGAGNLPCPTCHAQPGEVCENPGADRPAKIPHAARLRDAWTNAGRVRGGAL